LLERKNARACDADVRPVLRRAPASREHENSCTVVSWLILPRHMKYAKRRPGGKSPLGRQLCMHLGLCQRVYNQKRSYRQNTQYYETIILKFEFGCWYSPGRHENVSNEIMTKYSRRKRRHCARAKNMKIFVTHITRSTTQKKRFRPRQTKNRKY